MAANKMLFLFLLISTTFAKESDRIACDGIIFHDVYYNKEQLFTDRGRPYNLVFHKYSSVLFFSHTLQNGTHVDFGITSCHVDKKKCTDIAGVPGGYAIAYDPGNDDIYFGGHDGIYKYNFMTKAAEFFAEKGKSIWAIFVRDNFYYIDYPTQQLYVYQDDGFVRVAEAQNIEVDAFFLSKNNDIYFYNKTALYKIERATREIIILNDEIALRQISEDRYGDAFFMASDGVYIEDKPYRRIKKVANVDKGFGLTFDANDYVIYSDINSIYRLMPSKYNSLCYEAMTRLRNPDDDELITGERLLPKDIFL